MRCLPTKNAQGSHAPSKEAINACRERLTEEVLAYPRKVILGVGNSASRSFLQDHKFGITSKRGKPVDLDEYGIYIPTFHPAAVMRSGNTGQFPRFMADVRYAAALFNEGSEAIKRPEASIAHVLLKEPDVETFYATVFERNEAGKVKAVDVDTYRAWDDSITDGSQLRDWPKREVVTGIPAAVRAIDLLLEHEELAADIETGHSYSPRLGSLLSFGVAWSPTESVVFSQELIESRTFRKHLERLLTDPFPQWAGHNWKYDSGYLRWQIFGGEWPDDGALVPSSRTASGTGGYHDTMLEHYCLDETKGTHDLEQLAQDLLGADDYKWLVKQYTNKANKAKGIEADKGYENVPREILYPYNSLDCTHTFSIHQILCPKVHKSKGLTKLYNELLLPASQFLQRVQDRGLYVNIPFVQELDDEFSEIIERNVKTLEGELDRHFDLYPIERIKPSFDVSKAEDVRKIAAINKELGPTDWGPLWDTDVYMRSPWATQKRPDGYMPRNWRHTTFVLYRLIGWTPMNTNERTLRDLDQTGRDQSATFGYKAKNYARGHPNRKQQLNYSFIQALIDVRLATHAYGMLVEGTRKNMEPDGRLHTSFNLQATETGRLSSTGPNLQNLPVPEPDDERPRRNIVGVPPGYDLIEADYSQVELRLLAHYSNDEELIQVYLDGRDLHTELSIAIWGDKTFDAEGRQTGGYTNYQRVRAKAVNFGIAYGRGAGSIAAEHDIPEEEAKVMRDAWFARFPQATTWLRELQDKVLTGQTVITPFGRRRRFGLVSQENRVGLQNQATNFPMQGTGTDLTLLSAMRIQEKWDKSGLDAHVICLVHDAIVVEAHESVSARASDELKEIMEDTPKRVLRPRIAFPVDIHVGKAWGSLKFEEMTTAKEAKTVAGTFGKAGVASGKL